MINACRPFDFLPYCYQDNEKQFMREMVKIYLGLLKVFGADTP